MDKTEHLSITVVILEVLLGGEKYVNVIRQL